MVCVFLSHVTRHVARAEFSKEHTNPSVCVCTARGASSSPAAIQNNLLRRAYFKLLPRVAPINIARLFLRGSDFLRRSEALFQSKRKKMTRLSAGFGSFFEALAVDHFDIANFSYLRSCSFTVDACYSFSEYVDDTHA